MGFTLVDASDQSLLATLADGIAVELDDPDGGDYAIRADVELSSSIGSVHLELTGAKSHTQTENVAPYSLYGDGGDNALNGEALPVGSYLLQATAYSGRNKGGDDLGTLSVSFTVAETPDPADLAPTILTALVEGGGVSLSWNAPAEDADDVTGYRIERALGEGEFAELVSDTESTDTAYTDTTGEPGQSYRYRVAALRGSDRSDWSAEGSGTLPPDSKQLRPSIRYIQLNPDGPGVFMLWDAPPVDAESVTGYQVLRRQPSTGSSAFDIIVEHTLSTVTSYTDTTAEAGQTYLYRVKAWRGDTLSRWSSFERVPLPAVPTPSPEQVAANKAPYSLTNTLTGSGVVLSWEAPVDSDGITGYELRKSHDDEVGDYTTSTAQTSSTQTSHTIARSEFQTDVVYEFRVRAVRGAQTSDWSNGVLVEITSAGSSTGPQGAGEQLWSADLTVGEADSGSKGYDRSIGSLSATTVTIDDETLTIASLTYDPSTSKLSLKGATSSDDTNIAIAAKLKSLDEPYSYILKLRDEEFDFADATSALSVNLDGTPGDVTFAWSSASLDWSDEDEVEASIRKVFRAAALTVAAAPRQASVTAWFSRSVGDNGLKLRYRPDGDGAWSVQNVATTTGLTQAFIAVGGLEPGTDYQAQLAPDDDFNHAYTLSITWTTTSLVPDLHTNLNFAPQIGGTDNNRLILWEAELTVDASGDFGDDVNDAMPGSGNGTLSLFQRHLPVGRTWAGFEERLWQTDGDWRMNVHQTARRGSLTDPSDDTVERLTFTDNRLGHNIGFLVVNGGELRFALNIGRDEGLRAHIFGSSEEANRTSCGPLRLGNRCDVTFNWILKIGTQEFDPSNSTKTHITRLIKSQRTGGGGWALEYAPHPDYDVHTWTNTGLDWDHGEKVTVRLLRMPTNRVTSVTLADADPVHNQQNRVTITAQLENPAPGGTLYLHARPLYMGGRYYKHMFDGLWETVATAQIAANAASHSFTVDRDDFLDAGLAQVDLAQAQVTFNNYNDPTRLEFEREFIEKFSLGACVRAVDPIEGNPASGRQTDRNCDD